MQKAFTPAGQKTSSPEESKEGLAILTLQSVLEAQLGYFEEDYFDPRPKIKEQLMIALSKYVQICWCDSCLSMCAGSRSAHWHCCPFPSCVLSTLGEINSCVPLGHIHPGEAELKNSSA